MFCCKCRDMLLVVFNHARLKYGNIERLGYSESGDPCSDGFGQCDTMFDSLLGQIRAVRRNENVLVHFRHYSKAGRCQNTSIDRKGSQSIITSPARQLLRRPLDEVGRTVRVLASDSEVLACLIAALPLLRP